MSDFFTAMPQGQQVPAAMQGVGTLFNFIGHMGAASSSRKAGEAARTGAYFEAAQLDQQSGQSVAAAQRKALEEKRRATLIASRAQAVAGASGGSASDPTMVDILSDIEGEGAYRAGVALYEGEERARLQRLGASTRRFEGDVALQSGKERERAYQLGGFGSLATGAASLYSKYGRGGAKVSASKSSGDWFDAGTEGYSSIG